METLPVPLTTSMNSVFGGIYSSLYSVTGSTVFSTIFSVILIAAVLYLIWQVGKWIFNMFKEDPDKPVTGYYLDY